MSLIARIRRFAPLLARVHLALFALVWLSVIFAPCAMAMQLQAVDPAHDCPHCPPRPCHEVEPDQCEAPDSIDSPRLSEVKQVELAPPAAAAPEAPAPSAENRPRLAVHTPPARAGPRLHLLEARFDE